MHGSLALGLMLFCLAFDLASLTGVDIFKDRNQIRCTVNQTDPVTWFKDGVNLTRNINNGEYKEGRDDNNGHPTLKFNFTTDSEGKYSCIDKATPSNLTVDPEMYKNKSVEVIPDDNGTVLVPCGRIGPLTANNSRIKIDLRKSLDLRRVRYNWTKQETPEGSFDVYAEANYRHLSNSNYICTARVMTEVTTKEGYHQHHNFRGQSRISLKIAPHVVLDESAKENIIPTVGKSLNVSCNASHPDVSTIRTQWTKDGETVNDTNGNLVIQSLSLNNSGVYTCNASFGGLGNNKSFSLTVLEPSPTPSPSTPTTLTSTPETSSSLISEASSSTGTVQTTTTTSTTNNPVTGDKGNMLMNVLIVSIIVLLLVVVILLALLIIFYCTRKRSQKRSREDIKSRASPLQNNPHHQSPIPLPMSSTPSSLNNPSVTSGKQTITTWCESCCHSHTRSYPSIDRQSLAQSSCHNQCCSLSGSSHCSSKDARRHHDCHIFNHHNQNMSSTSTVPHHTCCHFVPHMHYPLPPPHTWPVNPSISVSHDSGCEAQKTLSNTRSEGSSCPHCIMHCHMSTDSGYHAMRTSTKEPWPGYSNEIHN